MKITRIVSLLTLILIFLTNSVEAQQKVTVEDLQSNSNRMLNNLVEIEGIVDRLIEDEGTDISKFIIRDGFGDLIEVRTLSGLPPVNEKFTFTGTFEIGSDRTPYIREQNRTRGSLDSETYQITINSMPSGADVFRGGIQIGTTPLSLNVANGTYTYSIQKLLYNNESRTILVNGSDEQLIVELNRANAFYAIIGLVALLIILALVIIFRQKKGSDVVAEKPVEKASVKVGGKTPNAKSSDYSSVDNPTVKFYQPLDKTVKILPGKFTVLSGLQDMDSLRFFGDSTGGNPEYTFGRSDKNSNFHFQFKSPTVSRDQAKLSVAGSDFILVNHASESSNPTIVNGTALALNESVLLNHGDIVEMGDVKLKFERSK